MRSFHVIFQKLWVDRCTPPYVLYILNTTVSGEARPADSDSTLNFKGGSRRGGESKGVKFRIIRKRREPFSSLPRSTGGSKFLFVEMVTRNNDF